MKMLNKPRKPIPKSTNRLLDYFGDDISEMISTLEDWREKGVTRVILEDYNACLEGSYREQESDESWNGRMHNYNLKLEEYNSWYASNRKAIEAHDRAIDKANKARREHLAEIESLEDELRELKRKKY